ncbi:hypothetical protein [Streptomyces yanii]|uniref:Uncharacterized protein n=1 Tax=Streptomyces yanii TaxID=78510 RepID=A0ABV5RID3_9ACTN
MNGRTGGRLLTPVDRDASVRAQRFRTLGLGERAGGSFHSFDAFADKVAEIADVPFSMVNFIDGNRQFFTVPRPWGRAGLDTIKSLAQELIGHIHRREDNGTIAL